MTNTEFKDDAIYVTVKEELEEIDLTITLNNKYGKLRLKAEEGEPEEEFEIYQITRKISLSSSLDSDSVTLTVTVMAEDGTEREQIIIITKDTDVALKTVEVNSEIIDYDKVNERYEALVPNANKPEVVITAENELQTVMLIDLEGNTIVSGIGKVTVTLNLSTEELEDNYIIKIISHKGENVGYEEYDLKIRQKSTETGILYIKVDNLGTVLSEDGLTYSTVVMNKESYPVDIKLKDEKAKVRIEDLEGNVIIENQTGKLTGDLVVLMGETKEFKVIVTSENGEKKEYTLQIENQIDEDKIIDITGSILTENYEGRHKSKVTLYKLGDPDEVVGEIETEEDGTFKIKAYTEGIDDPSLLDEKYEIVVTKKRIPKLYSNRYNINTK